MERFRTDEEKKPTQGECKKGIKRGYQKKWTVKYQATNIEDVKWFERYSAAIME